MRPDHDYVNGVKVAVCSNPSCLNREYPDYPRRNGNQEICYICGRLFTFEEGELGVICRDCKSEVRRNRRNRLSGSPKNNVRVSI
jgi:hypothetical protein